MSKYFSVVLALASLVSAAMPVIADEGYGAPAMAQQQPVKSTPEEKPMMKHAKMSRSMMVTGTIQSIDMAKNEVVIKSRKGDEKTISLNPAMMGDLKVNDRVTVNMKENSNTAASIKVMMMKKMMQPKSPEQK